MTASYPMKASTKVYTPVAYMCSFPKKVYVWMEKATPGFGMVDTTGLIYENRSAIYAVT